MPVVVTGATGARGGLGVAEIVASGREVERLRALAECNSNRAAFAGVSRMLPVPPNEPDPKPVRLHEIAIRVSRDPGTELAAHRGIVNADISPHSHDR